MNSIALLKNTYEQLYSQTSIWSRSNDILMTQALLLLATKSTDRCTELLSYYQSCRENIGIFSSIRGALLHTISVLGMAYNIPAKEIVPRIEHHRSKLKEIGLTGFFTEGSLYSTGAASYLALKMDDATELMPKIKCIMQGWAKDHPWVTGNNDLFYAVLHAMHENEANVQIRFTEDCFQALKRGGHSGWADELQAAAQAVALWPDVDLNILEKNYGLLIDLLHTHFSFFAPNLRPVTSLIAASQLPPQQSSETLMVYYNELGNICSLRRETKLLLAANLLLLEHFDADEKLYQQLISIVIGVIYAQEVTSAAIATAAASG